MYKCIGMDMDMNRLNYIIINIIQVCLKIWVYLIFSNLDTKNDYQHDLSLSLSAFSPWFSPYFQTKPICSAPPPRAYWACQSAPSEAAQVRPGARGKPWASLKPP